MTHVSYHPLPATHWSLVRRAGLSDEASRREALAALLERYLPALRSYLCTVRRMPPDAADELLQAFIADKVLEQQLFARADASRGKFRTFLLTSLQHFRIAQHRAGALRSTDALPEEEPAASQPPPGAAFDVAWVRALLANALAAMRAECLESGREDLWQIFEARVIAETRGEQPAEPYETLAARLRIGSPAQAANLLVTAKRMYARQLRAAIAEYEPDEENIEQELRSLHHILAAGGAADGAGDDGKATPEAHP